MTIASLIVDVLANTAKIEKDVAKVNSTLDSISSTAKAVGKALAAAFVVTEIIKLGRDMIDFASSLTDMAARTGLSTTALQKLGLVFEQSGISMDSAASGALKFQKLLGGDDKALVTLVGKLGLSFADLKKMAPEDAFLTIADAIGKIGNQNEKTLASTVAFGKGGTELLGGLNGHLAETAKHFEDLGLVIDGPTIAAADDFGDQLMLLGKQLMAIVASVVGPLLPALSALGNALVWIGTEVIGPIVNVAVKVLMTVLGSLWSKLAEIIGNLAELGSHLPVVGKQFAEMGDWLKKSAVSTSAYVGDLWAGTDKVAKSAKAAIPPLLGLGAAGEENAKTAKKLAEEHDKLIGSVRKLESAERGLLDSIGQVDTREIVALKTQTAMYDALAKVESTTRIAVFGFKGMSDELENVGEHTKPVIEDLEKIYGNQDFVGPILPVELPVSVKDGLKSIPQTLHDAFTGGGGIAGAIQAIGVDLGTALSNAILSNMKRNLAAGGSGMTGTGVTQAGVAGGVAGVSTLASGGSTRAAVGAVAAVTTSVIATGIAAHAAIPALLAMGAATAGIGLAAVGAYLVIKHFLSDTEKKINPIRDGFIDIAGGLGTLNERAHTAGVTLTALLDAKNPAQYKAAVDDLNAAFKFQDDSMQLLADTTARYGFTIEELGPALARQNLDQQAQGLYADFQVLIAGGIDYHAVLGKMGDSINEFVHSSLAMGVEVPNAMRPMLEHMVEMGTLTDASGNAITDLEGSGITFAMTMSEGFAKLIDGVKLLTDAISRGLGLAIQNIPSPHITGTVDWKVGTVPGLPQPVPEASGGMGRVTGPTLFLAGEAGAEDYAFSGGGKRFSRGGATGSDDSATRENTREIQGLRRDILTILPMHLKAAVAQAA